MMYNHFVELFIDPRNEKALERWPREILSSLSKCDSLRVREITYDAFCWRTSCAEDHLVTEMMGELDEAIWEKLADLFN